MSKLSRLLALFAGLVIAAPALAQEEISWENDPKVLACSPHVLKKGGSVALVMGPRHGLEMAIQRNGTRDWYFIVTGGPEKQHFMTPKAFGAARRVTLNEGTVGYGPPKGMPVRIFTRPGRYTVHLSDKLESDAGGHICTIDYRP